jgi:hypothetical protein
VTGIARCTLYSVWREIAFRAAVERRRVFRGVKFNQRSFRRGRLLAKPGSYFAAEEESNFWKGGSLPATAVNFACGRRPCWITAARWRVFETGDPYVMVRTLDLTGAMQE